jgi:AmmeMemoRadiSam system protein B
MQRQPAVAGQFYSGSSSRLHSELAGLIPAARGSKKVIGIIAPHAGYVYSGAIAGQAYAAIEIPATVLILGPNHHGSGAAAALYPDGEWITPLGPVSINSRLNALLQQHVPQLRSDTVAHQFEHSLEVQVPFIQYLRPEATISAVCLGHGDFAAIRQIGVGIAAAIRAYGADVLIVASSDMTHYESAESARHKEHITMCGAVPAAVMLVAAGELGATQAELVAYGTSGDVTGDNRQVVAYAAVTVW